MVTHVLKMFFLDKIRNLIVHTVAQGIEQPAAQHPGAVYGWLMYIEVCVVLSNQ